MQALFWGWNGEGVRGLEVKSFGRYRSIPNTAAA